MKKLRDHIDALQPKKVIRSICGRCFPPTLNNICAGTYDSLSQDLKSLRRRVSGLARRRVAVRRRALMMSKEATSACWCRSARQGAALKAKPYGGLDGDDEAIIHP